MATPEWQSGQCDWSIDSDSYISQDSESQSPHMNAWFETKGLHTSHLNIHFLYPKLDEIKYLTSNQQNIDILCLCETFLNTEFSDNDLKISNYNFFRKDRQSHGGVLVIYTKSNLACIHRDDLETEGVEMLWLEVNNNKQKSFLLCYCCRPPSTSTDCSEKIERSLEHANLEAKEIILLGDFNFNLVNKTNDPVWQHTFVSPSAFSRRAVVSYWRKYVHEVLVNRLGGLSLPRKSVVRLTDRPDMTLDVYRGR